LAKVVLTDAARSDLIDIWEFIAADNIRAADTLYDNLADGISLLQRFPELGHTRDDLPKEYRCLTRGNYLICYRVQEKLVIVVRIVQGSLNLRELSL
jgi:toxin ParE1/3/4